MARRRRAGSGEEVEAMQRGTRGLRAFGLNQIAILVRASHQMRAFRGSVPDHRICPTA